MSVLPVAGDVSPNEKAYYLVEMVLNPLNLKHPSASAHEGGIRGMHRWQIITVNRNGNLAYHYHRLGPAEMFPVLEIRIPSYWEYSVAELQDAAAHIRALPKETVQGKQAEIEPQDLKKGWIDQSEQQIYANRRRSTLAPGFAKQR